MKINELDFQSQMTCAITMILGIFIKDNEYLYFKYLGYILILICNIYYLKTIIYEIIHQKLAAKTWMIEMLLEKEHS